MGETLKDSPKDLLEELALAQPEVKIEDAPVASFGRGVARGALGPLLDLYYRATGQEETVKAQDALSPIAEGAGHVTGLLGGALASGGTGAVGKLGGLTVGGLSAKAGAATAKALSPKLGTTLGARLATGAASGAAEAGLAGLAEGSSAAALDREAGIPGVARHVMEGVGYGAALGAGFGALGTAFYRTNNWLFKKSFAKEIEAVGKARVTRQEANAKYNALIKELDTLGDDTTSREFANVTGARHRVNEILGVPGSSEKVRSIGGYKAEHGSELWQAQRALEDADSIISNTTSKNAQKLSSMVSAQTKSLINSGAAMAAGAMTGGPGGMFTGMLLRKMMPTYFASIADHALDGLGKFPALRQAIGRSIQAGDMTLNKTHLYQGKYETLPASMYRDRITGELKHATKGLDSVIDQALAVRKNIKNIPLHHMTNADYNDIVDEFESTDIGQYEMQTRLALMANGVPQEAISGHIDHQMRVQNYIKNVLPQRRDSSWLSPQSGSLLATDQERISLSRRMRAAMLPETVMSDFLDDRLTPEAVEAFWATSPQIASSLAEQVQSLVEVSAAYGAKIPSTRMRQLALLLNKPNQSGRAYNPGLLKTLQDNYIPKPAPQKPGQGGGTNIHGVSESALSGAQALAQRMAGPR